jgi:FHS family L-fucose permease-like MFS transporter
MLVAAISGGAAIPPMTGAVATNTGNFHKAMAIPTAFYVLAWVFPIYANLVSKDLLDGHRKTDLNIDRTRMAHAAKSLSTQLEDGSQQEPKREAGDGETVDV